MAVSDGTKAGRLEHHRSWWNCQKNGEKGLSGGVIGQQEWQDKRIVDV
jgi:hypothetical protein